MKIKMINLLLIRLNPFININNYNLFIIDNIIIYNNINTLDLFILNSL